jgi:hypothetical protein
MIDESSEGDRLPGGTVTPVVSWRHGPRATGPWTHRVHQLLRHLEAAGFDGAPRLLGIDEHGREVLAFIEREVTSYGPPRGMHTDEVLTAAAECFVVARRDSRVRRDPSERLAHAGRCATRRG